MNLLLHLCCGPCGSAIAESFIGSDIQATGFWYNPNIHPQEEHQKRLDSTRAMCAFFGVSLVEQSQNGLETWRSLPENDLARCGFCYDTRLQRTAQHAAENGYDTFSTSLLISPYQNREAILVAGFAAATRFGVTFLDTDYRPLYRRSRELARGNGWYLQKYCGCMQSWFASDHPKKPLVDWETAI